MPNFVGFRWVVWGAFCVCAAGKLGAQASTQLPLDDAAYAALDRIVGSGLVQTVFYGQRPYTRVEVARIVQQANANLASHAVGRSTRRLLAQLAVRFAAELQAAPQAPSLAAAGAATQRATTVRADARAADLELLLLNNQTRAIESAPTGGIAADVSPILNNRAGQRYATGGTFAATVAAGWSVGNRVAVQLQPRLAGGGHANNGFAELTLKSGSVAISALNMTLSVGRQQLVWGQGMEGGMLLSTSGRPLDMVRTGTDRPWRLPHPFNWLGLLRGTVFVADLGPRQNFPHALIAAYKGSTQVTSFFEFGVSMMIQQGGRGAPGASFADHFFDFFPFRSDHRANPPQFSNKIGGFDARLRIPGLHHAQLYAESIFDDIDPHRLQKAFWEDGGHILGLSLAELGRDGALSWTGEFRHTGLRYYRHTLFSSGVTFNRSLLGDPLGPQGDGANMRLRYDDADKQSWQLDAAIERRGGDVWDTNSDGPLANNFRFVLVQAKPAEWRRRVTGEWSLLVRPKQRLTIEGGVETVHDFSFVHNQNRLNALAGVKYTWLAW